MAMAKEADRRYPTAAALAEDLDRFERGEAVRARPPGRLAVFARWVARHRWMVRVAYAAILTGYVGAGVRLYQGAVREAALEEATGETREWVRLERERWADELFGAEAALASGRAGEAANQATGALLEYREDRLRSQVESLLRKGGAGAFDGSPLVPDLLGDLEIERFRAWAAHLRARAVWALGDPGRAEEDFARVLIEGHETPHARYALLDLARLELERGRLEESSQALETLLRLEPDAAEDRGLPALRARLAAARLAPGDSEPRPAGWSRRWEGTVRGSGMAAGDLLERPGDEVAILDGTTGRVRILGWDGNGLRELATHEVAPTSERVRVALWSRRGGRPARLAIWFDEGRRLELHVFGEGGLVREASGPAPEILDESRLALADLDGDGVPEAVLGAPGTDRTGRLGRVVRDEIVESPFPVPAGVYPLEIWTAPSGDRDEIRLLPSAGPRVGCLAFVQDASGELQLRGQERFAFGPDRSVAAWTAREVPPEGIVAAVLVGPAGDRTLAIERSGPAGPIAWSFPLAGDAYRIRGLALAAFDEPGPPALCVLADRGEERRLVVLYGALAAPEPPAGLARAPGPFDRLLAFGDLSVGLGLLDAAKQLYGEVLDQAGEASEEAIARAQLARARAIRLGGDPRRAASLLSRGLLEPGAGVRGEAAEEYLAAVREAGDPAAVIRFLDEWSGSGGEIPSGWIRERVRAEALAAAEGTARRVRLAPGHSDEPLLVEAAGARRVLRAPPRLPVQLVVPVEDGTSAGLRLRVDTLGLSPGDRFELGWTDGVPVRLGLRFAIEARPGGGRRVVIEPIGWRREGSLPPDFRTDESAGGLAIEFLLPPDETWVHVRLGTSGSGEFGQRDETSPGGGRAFVARLAKGSPRLGPARVELEDAVVFCAREEVPVSVPRPAAARWVEAVAAGQSDPPGPPPVSDLVAWAEPRIAAMPETARRVVLAALDESAVSEGDPLRTAEALLREGRLLESMALARRADGLEAVRVAGLAESRLGLADLAEATLTRCWLAGAGDAEVLAARGFALEALSRTDEAALDLRRALALDPPPALRDHILSALERSR